MIAHTVKKRKKKTLLVIIIKTEAIYEFSFIIYVLYIYIYNRDVHLEGKFE
jgi:hypothetical protein